MCECDQDKGGRSDVWSVGERRNARGVDEKTGGSCLVLSLHLAQSRTSGTARGAGKRTSPAFHGAAAQQHSPYSQLGLHMPLLVKAVPQKPCPWPLSRARTTLWAGPLCAVGKCVRFLPRVMLLLRPVQTTQCKHACVLAMQTCMCACRVMVEGRFWRKHKTNRQAVWSH